MILTFLFNAETASAKPGHCRIINAEDAARILGSDVVLADTSVSDEDGGRSWKCVFAAKSEDKEKAAKLYIMLERSNSIETAMNTFNSIVQSNASNPGFEFWNGAGDEAIAHSDVTGFHLVVIRKGTAMIRLKINPVGNTTLDALKTAAAEIVADIREKTE